MLCFFVSIVSSSFLTWQVTPPVIIITINCFFSVWVHLKCFGIFIIIQGLVRSWTTGNCQRPKKKEKKRKEKPATLMLNTRTDTWMPLKTKRQTKGTKGANSGCNGGHRCEQTSWLPSRKEGDRVPKPRRGHPHTSSAHLGWCGGRSEGRRCSGLDFSSPHICISWRANPGNRHHINRNISFHFNLYQCFVGRQKGVKSRGVH